MCEWTPPCETSPSRWTSPPAREGGPQRRVLEEGAVLDRAVDPLQVLVETRPEPIVRWPTSELPIWPGGSPTASPEASSVVCG